MTAKNFSRRSFVKSSAFGAGVFALGGPTLHDAPVASSKLPREAWIASVSTEGFRTPTHKEMLKLVLSNVEIVVKHNPDIICFPETFVFSGVNEKMNLNDKVEFSQEVLSSFADLARENSCYIICPVITSERNKKYNAAVMLGREGNVMGEYRKMHPTENEMADGISPGPPDPLVFKTDFGNVGIQICFDIQWNDGWEHLAKKGAEIVFWPSAFGGGNLINTKAWSNKYAVVSSTLKGNSKICDVSGVELASTGSWQPNWVCSAMNLEKAVIHTWPYVRRFPEIQKKYGRRIRIVNFDEEEYSIIESLSPDVFIKDILKEFNIKTHAEHIASATQRQLEARE